MGDERAMKLFEMDNQITRLEADLRELAMRASGTGGSADEERLAGMIEDHETRLAALREMRAGLACGVAPGAARAG